MLCAKSPQPLEVKVLSNLPEQADLFRKPVFETREAKSDLDIDQFRSRIKRGMAAYIRDHDLDRNQIAMEMARLTKTDTLSKAMLDAYTSESKSHEISLPRFKAFVWATGAHCLWDDVISDEGLIILAGDEARLAEIARLQQERKALGAELRQLMRTPVNIQRGGK